MQASPAPRRILSPISSKYGMIGLSLVAVGKDDDRVGVFQRLGVPRPMAVVRGGDLVADDGLQFRQPLGKALGQQQAAGVILVLGVGVAGRAGQEHDLLLGGAALARIGRRGQRPEPDVAELDLHRLAGVELQGEDAVPPRHAVLVGQLAHQLAR